MTWQEQMAHDLANARGRIEHLRTMLNRAIALAVFLLIVASLLAGLKWQDKTETLRALDALRKEIKSICIVVPKLDR